MAVAVRCVGRTKAARDQCRKITNDPSGLCWTHRNRSQSGDRIPKPETLRTLPPFKVDLDDTFHERIYQYLLTIPLATYAFLSFRTTRQDDKMIFTFVLEPTKPIFGCVPRCPKWDDIRCDEEYPLRSNCRQKDGSAYEEEHRRDTLFVHGFRDFYEYTSSIQSGTVPKKLHRRIWNTIRHTLVSNPLYTLLNHNRDIDTLHFKYASNSSK
jgi:hypothetical protein